MVGFVYEADQDAIKEAQDRVDELRHNEMLNKIDEAIDAIEENKRNDNVYDYAGNEVLKSFETDMFKKLYESFWETINTGELFDVAVSKSVAENAQRLAQQQALSIQIGDINLSDVQNVDDLANAIIQQLPNALLQKMYQ